MSEKSEFVVQVVRIGEMRRHPNADSLSITNVYNYPVFTKTGTFQEGDLAVYIPADSLVPTDRPEFAFLAKNKGPERLTPQVEYARIKAMRLRGIFSMGLLVPAPAGMQEGDDAQQALGVEKWISPEERRLNQPNGPAADPDSQRSAKARINKFMPEYGLDAYRKIGQYLEPGALVVITEKIHGANARFCYKDGRFWVGSHRAFRGASRHRIAEFFDRLKFRFFDLIGKKHEGPAIFAAGDVWWEAAEKYDLKNKLKQRPGFTLYGEVYGHKIQDLTYDTWTGERSFAAFDVLNTETGKFLPYREFEDFCDDLDIPTVPEFYVGPWDPSLLSLAEGTSAFNENHVREGIVIKSLDEKFHDRLGRVALKHIGEGYYLRATAEENTKQNDRRSAK